LLYYYRTLPHRQVRAWRCAVVGYWTIPRAARSPTEASGANVSASSPCPTPTTVVLFRRFRHERQATSGTGARCCL